jgi:hypothetical protein
MIGEDDEDTNQEQEDVIPGDNDKQSEEKWPSNADAPTNLTIVPAADTPISKDLGGD